MSTLEFRTPLCAQLGIDYPIILAGMGVWGMATPPALVAAVSNAGGLGVLGCSALSPEEIRHRIQAVRALTDRPFGVDLLLPASLAPASTTRSGVRKELAQDYPQHVAFYHALLEKFELEECPVQNDIVLSDIFIDAQIKVCIEERIPVFAAGLGDPARVLPQGREIGMTVIGLSGSVRNAARQAAVGVDIIVAQGTEAGGHTGRIANFSLLPETVDAVAPVPVVAAGGIVDGRGVAAALMLGATGVWLGTAFLVAEESGLPLPMKQALVDGRATDFQISRYWTGKTLRSMTNPAEEAWQLSGLPALPTPHQRVLMEDFLEAAKAAGRWELFMNAAGQGAGALKEIRPAADIMADLVEQSVAAFDSIPERVQARRVSSL